jgi:hypothetical protein
MLSTRLIQTVLKRNIGEVQVKMEKWSQEVTLQWLQKVCRIDENQAQIFRDQKIDGEVLESLTTDDLRRDPFNFSFGEAKKIILQMEKLQKSSGQTLLLCAVSRSPKREDAS